VIRALVALALALAALPRAAAAEVQRFAVLIGNNEGAAGEVALRYAEDDAGKMRDVLRELGGFRPERLLVLAGEDADTVRRALLEVNDEIRGAGGQAVLVVYYSGHADAAALHLGRSRLLLEEL
jgi:hypothetical protein